MIDFLDHALLLNESYRRWYGEYLVAEQDPGLVLEAINADERVIVSHGLEEEPIFNYGNVRALFLFACGLDEFLRLPSKSTVREEDLVARQALHRAVEANGCADYSGVRLAQNGKAWLIESGRVWQLVDNLGRIHGHGACFTDWQSL